MAWTIVFVSRWGDRLWVETGRGCAKLGSMEGMDQVRRLIEIWGLPFWFVIVLIVVIVFFLFVTSNRFANLLNLIDRLRNRRTPPSPSNLSN